MSGPPRIRSMNVTVGDTESRPVLVPAGNKARPIDGRKPLKKPTPETEKKPANPQCALVTPAISKQRQNNNHHQVVLKNLSMNASCSSDASSTETDSSNHSSGASSSGKVVRRVKKKQVGLKIEKVVNTDAVAVSVEVDSSDSLEDKKRCAWVTPNTGIFIYLLA